LLFRFLPLLLVSFLISQSSAQDKYAYHPWQIDTLVIAETSFAAFSFPENHRVIEQSVRILLNNRVLEHLLEYRFQSVENQINFYSNIQAGDSLKISYQILPVLLRKKYTFFQLDTLTTFADSTDSVSIIKPVFENPFAGVGGNLKRSGSIVRGVNIGSNKDLTLNSGLNLQLSGNLTDDLEIVAALTDASTPIQPEGNTQTLREIDQVFIKFNSPWVNGVLGDFNLKYSGTQYGSFSRKLQGISLTGNYKDFEMGGSVASTRGFFNFMTLIGHEGNQGPYQLLGKNKEKEIIVLAGTERVWINGEKLVRGENNDYVIEYGNGQIIFTNKRLITSESRIEVDFEYYPAAQKYTRNVYSGISNGSFFSRKISYRISYYHEEDDPEKILEAEGILSEQEKKIIEDAGDDPLKGAVGSAVFVGDSLGFYLKVDTLLNGSDYVYYKYVGQLKGDYQVTFSSVGFGNGDYRREGLGFFRWIGIGKGEYLPVSFLPLPSRQQLIDMQIEYQPTEKLLINAEAAVSQLDKNILSPINDRDNQGNAFSLTTRLDQVPLRITNTELGQFGFSLNGKYIDKKFQPIDRLNQPDFSRYWNLLSDTEESNEEQSIEFKSTYLPWHWLTVNGGVGDFKRSAFNSFRYHGEARWDKENWFRGFVRHESVNSLQGKVKNDWYRQKADVNKDIWIFQPALLFEQEERKNREGEKTSGFAFLDLGARLRLINHPVVSGELQFNQRKDNVIDPDRGGEKIPQATSWTRRLRLDLAEWHQLSGYLQIVLRKKDYTPFFESQRVDSLKLQYLDYALQDTVWQDRQTNLIEFLLKNYQWNRALDVQWQYRVSIGQTALKEKVYIDVGEGQGNFRYDDDLKEYVPDPFGNFILFIVPSGKFEPIANLGTSLRLLLDPRRILKKPETGFEKIISQLSSDSYFRVEEESKDENLSNLYFLKFSTFQGQKTLRGNIVFNQDLYFMRRNRDHSFRFRYRYRDDLFNQFLESDDNENRLSIERGLWANYRIIETIKSQTEFRNILTFRENPSNTSRNRDINSFIIDQKFSFRPDLNWEFGIESEYGREKDNANQKNLSTSYIRGLARASYALLRRGKISTSFDYQRVNILENPTEATIPYEMARGRKEGVSKSWQIRGEYTIAENVVVSLFYNGRDDADFERIIHTGQAEIRAYF